MRDEPLPVYDTKAFPMRGKHFFGIHHAIRQGLRKRTKLTGLWNDTGLVRMKGRIADMCHELSRIERLR